MCHNFKIQWKQPLMGETKVVTCPFIWLQVGRVLVCRPSTAVAVSWCVCHINSHKLYLPFSGPEQEAKAAHWSCQQCCAFYIITMFIGFLFSQWQKGHLPTATLQRSSKISCETCRGNGSKLPDGPHRAPVKEDAALAVSYTSPTKKNLKPAFSCFLGNLFLKVSNMVESWTWKCLQFF